MIYLSDFQPLSITKIKNFLGGQICNDEYMYMYTSKIPRIVDFDCIMKAFFDERQ